MRRAAVALLCVLGCGGGRATPAVSKALAPRDFSDPCDGEAECRERCQAGDGEACYDVPFGPDSEALNRRACELGSGRACLNEAADSPEGTKHAVALLEEQCRAQRVQACGALADHYGDGPADEARELRYRQKACAFGGAQECAELIEMRWRGHDYEGSDPYRERLLAIATDFCHRKRRYHCEQAAELVFTHISEETASELMRPYCEAGEPVCGYEANVLLKNGDNERAADYWEHDCDRGELAACRNAAGATKDPARSAKLHARVCYGLHWTDNCIQAASLYLGRGEKGEAIAVLDEACKQNHVGGCMLLATTVRPDDPARAFKLYRRACDDEREFSRCGPVAEMLAAGEGTTADRAGAVTLLEDLCQKEAPACLALVPLTEDAKRRRNLQLRACKLRDGATCLGLARAAEDAAEYPVAMALYTAGCSAYSAPSCMETERLRAERQHVPKKKIAEVAKAALSACKKDRKTCGEAALFLDHGAGTTRDRARAATLRKDACDAGDHAACIRIAADRAFVAGEFQPARELLDDECTQGQGAACRLTAWVLIAEARATGAGHPSQAYEYQKRACTHGDAAGCRESGQADKACQMGDIQSCLRQAAADKDKVQALQRKGCEEGWPSLCYEAAKSVPEAERKALYQKGCETGDGRSCIAIDDKARACAYAAADCEE